KTDEHCEIHLEAGSKVLLFGGDPLPEERYLLWNFVSHSKDRLKKAKEAWKNKKFPRVPNDNTYIPLPDML
ncbi:MAG: redox-sensitive bicupin YhaK (pirin superfamily), partial [Arcticibacterium sp.]